MPWDAVGAILAGFTTIAGAAVFIVRLLIANAIQASTIELLSRLADSQQQAETQYACREDFHALVNRVDAMEKHIRTRVHELADRLHEVGLRTAILQERGDRRP